MPKIIPIVITILRYEDQYLFIQRKNPPYEGLWSLVGGKVDIGEHIVPAAIREVMEETGAKIVTDYEFRGLVSERLVDYDEHLLSHFLIFVGHATIDRFSQNHREGDLALFTLEDISEKKDTFLPSDYEMFQRFLTKSTSSVIHEVELLYDDKGYHLVYYRVPDNAS